MGLCLHATDWTNDTFVNFSASSSRFSRLRILYPKMCSKIEKQKLWALRNSYVATQAFNAELSATSVRTEIASRTLKAKWKWMKQINYVISK